MKSKTSFFNGKLFADTLKRYWWFGLMAFLAQFFSSGVNFIASMKNISRSMASLSGAMAESQGMELMLKRRIEDCVHSFFAMEGMQFEIILMMLFAVSAGLIFFNYLHKKQQVNFFHSQPIKRESLFTIRILAACILVLAPYIVNQLIMLALCAVFDGMQYVVVTGFLARIGFVALAFLTILAVTTLAASLTGTTFAQFEMVLLLLFTPIAVYGCITWLMHSFLATYIDTFTMAYMLSPFVHFAAMGEYSPTFLAPLFYLLLTIAAFALALLLYRKRPSEAAGTPVVFRRVTEPVVRLSACFVASVMLGMMFGTVSGSIGMFAFGMAAGALLCHMFCEGQFNKDFKSMFKHLPQLGIFAVCLAAFTLIITNGAMRFDDYLPDPAKVKSVSVAINTDSETRPDVYTDNSRYAGALSIFTVSDPWSISLDEYLAISAPESVDIALDMAGSIVGEKNYNDDTMFSDSNTNANFAVQNTPSLTFTYNMANGRKITRRYDSVDASRIYDSLQSYISAPDYRSKHQVNSIVEMPSTISATPVKRDYDGRDELYLKSPEEISSLIGAIKQDVMEHGLRLDKPKLFNLNLAWTNGDDVYTQYTMTMQLAVYAHYQRALAELERLGAEINQFKEEYIDATQEIRFIDGIKDDLGNIYTIDDKARIRELMTRGDVLTNTWYDGITIYSKYVAVRYDAEQIKQLEAADEAKDDAIAQAKRADELAEGDVMGIIYKNLPADVEEHYKALN